ncbi:helix-turn-helix domain-containing protein [Polaribacter sp. Q13]|uniref:helix-turn-helix domain-containing protein n=1 Tax=Polaribacter sp. Q13 TaxID=2806551 RepID=UPI00193AFC43|nr:helix-turn-helix domain-containing protein [Polaribacter sp. Q13]QVY66875.1 helix-turn-helix domain-containing protein [Polaribacter sp. Q13]
MITKTVQITEVTIEELSDKIADKLLLKIEVYLKDLSKSRNVQLLKRKEVADLLRVSLVTIDAWSRIGLINPIRMGNKKFFKKQDILDVLEQQTINKKQY